jgi:hypothetical protein
MDIAVFLELDARLVALMLEAGVEAEGEADADVDVDLRVPAPAYVLSRKSTDMVSGFWGEIPWRS